MLVNDRGLTLAEILVALAIVGIGLVGLLAIVPVATYGVQEGSQLSTATFLAEQGLEQVRNAVWTQVRNLDCLGVGPTAAPTSTRCDRSPCALDAGCTTFPDEPSVTGYPAYSREVRVIDCGTTACGGVVDSNLRLAIVNVSYRPMTARGVASTPKTVRLSLLIAKRQ
ncbi:MAG TPA: prepilin-type N-terminal cleavage/methylation domain-containing protein [Candidatus Binatia bacterium]|nr:prepilin-type N-terminal cleavage/methylation domain-containing protein [Candidatus Binatia bacterium]